MTRQQVNNIIIAFTQLQTICSLIIDDQVSKEYKEQFLKEFKVTINKMEDMNKSFEITAEMIRSLREHTGEGMMSCKKALVACNGNHMLAKEYLRQSGTIQI